MYRVLIVAVFSALALTGRCEDEEEFPLCRRSDIDGYADDVLARARTELPDPMRLPPRSTFVELSDGLLWGMSGLSRLDHAHAVCVDGHTVVVKMLLTSDEVKGRYTWTKERRNQEPHEGFVTFISHDFEAEVDVEIRKPVEGEEAVHPKLVRFEIRRFRDAKVEMTGMGFITWALGEMTTLFSGVFQRSIASSVQGPLKEAVERVLREVSVKCAQGIDFDHFCDP